MLYIIIYSWLFSRIQWITMDVSIQHEKIVTYTNFLYIMITATAITTSMTPNDPPITGAEEVSSINSFS